MEILSKFKVDQVYRFIIYVSSLVFILSLFVSIIGVESGVVQSKSLRIALLGMITWFIVGILYDLANIYGENKMAKYYTAIKAVQGFYIFITITILS